MRSPSPIAMGEGAGGEGTPPPLVPAMGDRDAAAACIAGGAATARGRADRSVRGAHRIDRDATAVQAGAARPAVGVRRAAVVRDAMAAAIAMMPRIASRRAGRPRGSADRIERQAGAVDAHEAIRAVGAAAAAVGGRRRAAERARRQPEEDAERAAAGMERTGQGVEAGRVHVVAFRATGRYRLSWASYGNGGPAARFWGPPLPRSCDQRSLSS